MENASIVGNARIMDCDNVAWSLLGLGTYMGTLMLRDFYTDHIECEVGDLTARQRTRNKIKDVITRPINIATIIAIFGLAFTVNAIEFACSSVIPVVYNSVLAGAKLATGTYYLYILAYVFFFMLDDLIIFSLAAFAVNKFIGDKYVRISKLVGGSVLFALGVMIVFFPDKLW